MSFFSSVVICRHFDLYSIGNSETKVIAKINGYRLLISASPCAIVSEKALTFLLWDRNSELLPLELGEWSNQKKENHSHLGQMK